MEFLSLDGVYQAPGGPDEDTTDGFTQGGWFVPYVDDVFMQRVLAWVDQADGFLFGRRTYENFARDWPNISEADNPAASKLNGLPKYVASQSLKRADWEPTTILRGDIPAAVAKLKQQPGRELQIHGSGRLARSLLTAGLIDELRLAIAPVVLGNGRRLFPSDSTPTGFRVLRHEGTPSGLAVQVYEPAGEPRYATYGT
jgi:dihydrofolate reductase